MSEVSPASHLFGYIRMQLPLELRIIRAYCNESRLSDEYRVTQIGLLATDALAGTAKYTFTAKVLHEVIRRCRKYKVTSNALSNLSAMFDKLNDLSYADVTDIRRI